MKVTQETQSSMTFKDNQFFLILAGTGFLIAGCVFIINSHQALTLDFLRNNWLDFACIAIGILLIFIYKSTTIVLDKTIGKMTFTYKGLFGKKMNEYLMSNLVRLELRARYDNSRQTNNNGVSFSVPRLVYQLVFLFNDGLQLPLDNISGGDSTSINGIPILMGGKGKEEMIGQKIATFLNIPYQKIEPPNPMDMIKTAVGAIQGNAPTIQN